MPEQSSHAMNGSSAQITSAIGELCRSEGFSLWGCAALEPTQWEAELRAWIAAGKHGTMNWLADMIQARLDPNRVLEGARSVVMVADLYATRQEGHHTTSTLNGKIARYARGNDYHKVIKKRLARVCDRLRDQIPHAQTRVFCDTAPVLEREMARLCGLGWIGKHTLLINPKLGSWMLLGGFFTTLEIAPAEKKNLEPDHCGSCTRCIDACPTDAITPYSVDARACISYLTIEHRHEIAPALAEKLDGWMFGCDICQEVCPHNSPRSKTCIERPRVREDYAPRRTGFDLLKVLGWDEHARRKAFQTSALKRAKLAQFKRNAVCVLGGMLDDHETGKTTLSAGQIEDVLAQLRQVARDVREDALVRSAADRVLKRSSAG